jgi:hypothetical protein
MREAPLWRAFERHPGSFALGGPEPPHYIGNVRLNISGKRVFGFVDCKRLTRQTRPENASAQLLATVTEKLV